MKNLSKSLLPHFAAGKITHGFGRGSKELGEEFAILRNNLEIKKKNNYHLNKYFANN